jgi:glycerophosphoryl diester phosphodiesterase
MLRAVRSSLCFPLLAALALGCSNGSSTTPDAGAPDAAADGPVAIVDPTLFDCTSLTRPPLPRKAASTEACLRDPGCRTRLVSAHRGAGGGMGRLAPEDTLAAYRAGIAIGVDLVETDPRPTKDGVIVNIHDTTVDRTTTGTGTVSEMTLAQVQALPLRTEAFAGDFSCERVPTLVDLLRTCKGRAMVLVDANKTDRVDLLVQAIRDADALDWAVFDTSSLDKIDQALALEPKLLVMPRVEVPADAPLILAKPWKPLFVEIDSKIFPQTVDAFHGAGLRTLTDVFATDLTVKFGTDRKAYLDLYAQGADVLQSDLPDEVLRALGRPVPP